MVSQIVRKEFLNNLLSARFVINVVYACAVFLLSFVLFVRYDVR